jgi:hypothetical protein
MCQVCVKFHVDRWSAVHDTELLLLKCKPTSAHSRTSLNLEQTVELVLGLSMYVV